MRIAAAAMAVLVATACEGTVKFEDDALTDTSGEDVETDMTTDTTHDIVPDTLPDLPVDTSTDTVADTTEDVPVDTAVDTSEDTAIDVPVDTAVDTSIDTAPDTSIDTAVDTHVDPDVVLDTGIDTAVDTHVDPDVVLDTGVDTAVDTTPDVLPDEPCTPVAALSCDTTITGANNGPGSTNLLEVNSCVGYNENGPEIAYSFTAVGNTSLSLDLTGLAEDLDLFLFGRTAGVCDTDTCLDYSAAPSTDPEHLDYNVSAGTTVYVLIDGFNYGESTFSLQVSCADAEICTNGIDDDGDTLTDCRDFDCMATPACPETCTAFASLSCGSSVSGSTTTAPDEIDRWSCNDVRVDGPERIYSFTSTTSRNVNFELSGHDPALDVFVIGATSSGTIGCVSTGCIAYDVFSVDFWAEAGRTYYLVVDGTGGYAGAYTATVTCG